MKNYAQGCDGQGKYLEKGIFSRSGSQGIVWMVREIWKGLEKSGNLKINGYCSLQKLYLFCSRGNNVLSS